MRRRSLLLGLLALAVPAASPAMQGERVLRTDIVTATFTGWERGDYVWAQLAIGGRRESAMPGDDPIGPFLEAHRARPLRIWIATVRTTLPEAGTVEIRRIVQVRYGNLTAERWWNRLSPRYRRAWLRRFHEAIG
jgi:hypothetical protein